MTRTTNFARQTQAQARGAILAVWTIAAAFAIACAALTYQGLTLLDQEQTLTQHIAKLRTDIAELEKDIGAAPSAAEYAALSARIDYHNALLGDQHADLLDVLSVLETAVPGDVWLRDLSYDAPTGRFNLSLLSRDETALPAALQSIEGSALFEDVILKRQLQMRQGNEELVQYEVGGVAR